MGILIHANWMNMMMENDNEVVEIFLVSRLSRERIKIIGNMINLYQLNIGEQR